MRDFKTFVKDLKANNHQSRIYLKSSVTEICSSVACLFDLLSPLVKASPECFQRFSVNTAISINNSINNNDSINHVPIYNIRMDQKDESDHFFGSLSLVFHLEPTVSVVLKDCLEPFKMCRLFHVLAL